MSKLVRYFSYRLRVAGLCFDHSGTSSEDDDAVGSNGSGGFLTLWMRHPAHSPTIIMATAPPANPKMMGILLSCVGWIDGLEAALGETSAALAVWEWTVGRVVLLDISEVALASLAEGIDMLAVLFEVPANAIGGRAATNDCCERLVFPHRK